MLRHRSSSAARRRRDPRGARGDRSAAGIRSRSPIRGCRRRDGCGRSSHNWCSCVRSSKTPVGNSTWSCPGLHWSSYPTGPRSGSGELLENTAATDSLAGLASRRAWDENRQRARSRGSGPGAALRRGARPRPLQELQRPARSSQRGSLPAALLGRLEDQAEGVGPARQLRR
jgi:hypothetical protein